MGVLSIHHNGRAMVRVAELAAFRASVAARLGQLKLPNNIKHADDQAVVALAAMIDVVGNRPVAEYREWAAVVAPRYPGRTAIAATLDKFAKDGAWGVSPHLIPHYSLHSPSGLVSVTFGMTGPNIGAGGTHGREFDALSLATTLIDDSPGVIVILTGEQAGMIRGVALDLRTAAGSAALDWQPHRPARAAQPRFSLESLHRIVGCPGPVRASWSLPEGGSLSYRQQLQLRMAA